MDGSTSDWSIALEEATAESRQAILNALREFNTAQAGPPDAHQVCVAIRDENGVIAGGLWGVIYYDWLMIELLVVPEELRGRGSGAAMVAQAEQQARDRGCIGAWLDTFSFQARGFYERLGYHVVGAIEDHPRGGARYFLTKRWGA